MSTKPIVTVIIPAYNAAAFISDSIASVINQSYQNIDLIVINDGSSDNTLGEIRNFEDDRLRCFDIDNSGQCAAANFGLKHARGEYIKFLDSDDLLNPNHLESMVNLATEFDNQLILCKWARFNDSVEKAIFIDRPEWRDAPSIDWFCKALSDGPDMLPVWQWLIPRKVIDKSGDWDETLGLGNDFEFSSRLLMAVDGVKFCNDAWVYYRSGLTANMSTDVSSKTYMSVLDAIHKSKSVVLGNKSMPILKEAYANKYFSWLITYYPYLNADIVREVERNIYDLGQVSYQYDWGWKFQLVSKWLGWKTARKLQFYYYSTRYNK